MKLLRILSVLLWLGILCLLLSEWCFGYGVLLQSMVEVLGLSVTKDQFEILFSLHDKLSFRVLLISALFCLPLVVFLLQDFEFTKLQKTGLKLPSLGFVVVLGVTLGLSAWLPYSVDEVFTFREYISRGVGVSWSLYTGPNNHLLFSLIGAMVYKMTGSPWLSLRLMNVLLIACLAYKFSGLDKTLSWEGVVKALLLLLNLTFVFYVLQGRAYAPTSLIVFLIWIDVKEGVFNREKVLLLSLLLLAFLLTNFYVVLALYVVCVLKGRMNIRQASKDILLVYAAAYLFYLPVLLFSSPASLLTNSWVTKVDVYSASRWWSYLVELGEFLGNDLGLLPVLMLILIGVLSKERVSILILTLICFALPLIHQRFPPVRVFVYLIPLLFYGVTEIIETQFNRKVLVLGLLLLIVIGGNLLFIDEFQAWYTLRERVVLK